MTDYLTRLRARRAALQQRALAAPDAQVPYVCSHCAVEVVVKVVLGDGPWRCVNCRHAADVVPIVTAIAELDRAIAWAKSSEVTR